MARDRDTTPQGRSAQTERRSSQQGARRRLGLWWHRLRHPLATARWFAALFLPFRVRRSLLRLLRPIRRPSFGTAVAFDAFLGGRAVSAQPAARPRPTVLCLSVIDWQLRVQRPHHLLGRLAARGWPVLYSGTELAGGAGHVRLDLAELAPNARAVTLPGARRRSIGEDGITAADVRVAAGAIEQLAARERLGPVVTFCQSPAWRTLALELRERSGWPIVYDRIDLHRGFSTTSASIGEEDRRLVREANLMVATSECLASVDGDTRRPVLRLPNGCDPEHWTATKPAAELAELPRPIIGYFGAISEWFDVDLVEEMAISRPDWSIVLIGSTWGTDVVRLGRPPNVHLLGERSYSELPSLASAFDVGIIPFRRTPLTEATDPVKLYEMMALGLEVVAPSLPEIARHGDLVRCADGCQQFVTAVEDALAGSGEPVGVEQRRSFALKNSWDARADVLESALVELFPSVCIGIVTYNNRDLNALCLDSVAAQTLYPNYEVVIVDNASTDGTAGWLREEVATRRGHRVVLNESNLGFAAACNQAFGETTADILCFLNNDTVVTRGWLSTLVQALTESPEVGLVGPSSNGVANEARVEPGYDSLDDLHAWAAEFMAAHRGESFSIPMLALYCAALPRSVWHEVGGLDERFEVGFFEDDDFSRRIRRTGYDVRCRRDAWVHHFQGASFGKLSPEAYERIYEANRRRFHAKWRSDSPGGE